MRPEWTKNAVGKMHQFGVKNIDLARRLNVTPEYVCMILNGKRTLTESSIQRILSAIEEECNEKSHNETS